MLDGYDEPATNVVKPNEIAPVVVGAPAPSQGSAAGICNALAALQRQRRFAIKSQSRCDRAVESYLAGLLGFRTDLTPAERKSLFTTAANLRKAIEKTGALPKGVTFEMDQQGLVQLVLQSAVSRAPWDSFRDDIEASMKKLARQLPVWKGFAADVRGLGELGLAIIVGETTTDRGDLGSYANPAKVWKRLGLAVIGGIRQQKRTNKDEAAEHGYNPARRAEMWAFFSDAMFRSVWRGAVCLTCGKKENGTDKCKCEEPVWQPAYPIGPYGAEYGRKKAGYLAREWSPKHADSAARRYMTKCLLRDLWAAWRAADDDGQPKPPGIGHNSRGLS